MLHTEAKLEARINELLRYRYRDKHRLGAFRMKEDHSGQANPDMPIWEETDQTLDHKETWSGRDRYLWLERKLTLPVEWERYADEESVVGVFDFGLTGGGYNSGFESMLYLDGKPYQAVDSNHQEVFFQKKHFGRELTLTFRLWSGLEGGGEPKEMVHCYRKAYLALLDRKTDDLYYLADTALGAARILSEERPERVDLLEALDQAFLLIDWTAPGSRTFYESVGQADENLNKSIDRMDKYAPVEVSCVGHTHIDTAWLWRLKHTREKASRSFATVLRLMEQFPEYYFLHTQPQQYAYVKEDFPELYEQIRQRVREGRWEIDGGMWVEADCNLPSGESLTRQFLLGRRFMLEEFGREPEYLWLPDVFGYSWALPQILKKSGIDTFMTTKISWNQYNHMPNDTFWWKGIDGSCVLAHFITTPDQGQSKERFYATYNGLLYPDTVQGAWEKYQDKRLNKEILLCYGYGDGGGGVNRDMLERRRRLDRIPGLPRVTTSRADAYFRRLHETVAHTRQPMATWDGEMYLEFHRGTYTSQAYNKKMNRRMEELYRKAEWLTAMKGLQEGTLASAEQEVLTEGWKILLTHQFHDIIPGSSIHEVYEDSRVNYGKAEEIAESVIANFYDAALEQKDGVISVLNPWGEDRSGILKVDWECLAGIGKDTEADAAGRDRILVTEENEPVILQYTADGAVAYVKDIPAMGVKHLYVREHRAGEGTSSSAEQGHAQEERTSQETERGCACAHIEETSENRLLIRTAYYQLVLNENGQIEKLYDNENECQVLAEDACGNVLQLFEDKPLGFDAWDIDMYYYQKMEEITDLTEREIVENGPVRTVIRQSWQFHSSRISQDMILYAQNRRIDFKTQVDWQETHKLLKVAFPVDIRATAATYEIQYGNVKRANNSNTSWERARFESVAHRFVDLSEHGYGVSLLNDCKYGHDVHGNVMRLSLLKAATYPDYAADKGEHTFTYALFPHKGDFIEGGTIPEAFDLNQPMEAISGQLSLPTEAGKGLVRLTGAHVELDAIKKSEDGRYLVLRFHEYAGDKGKVTVETGFAVRAYAESDLMERALEDFKSGEIRLSIRPYEIKTVLLDVGVQ